MKTENLPGRGGGATGRGMRRVARAAVVVAGLMLLASCAGPQNQGVGALERQTTPEEIAQWRQQQGLTVASEADMAAARSCEGKFFNDRATSPDDLLLNDCAGDGRTTKKPVADFKLRHPFPFSVG